VKEKDTHIMPQESIHKSYVRWGKDFGGHGTELIIKQYETWSEVVLVGGGRRSSRNGDDMRIVDHCPIEVMRQIVAMHDALPPFPAAPKRSNEQR
jgi:hypothetical protein